MDSRNIVQKSGMLIFLFVDQFISRETTHQKRTNFGYIALDQSIFIPHSMNQVLFVHHAGSLTRK